MNGEKGEGASDNQSSENLITKDYGRGEIAILQVKPKDILKDADTGEDTVPVLFAQGYGGDTTLPWYLKAFAKTGRRSVGVGFIGKRRNNSTRFVSKEGVKVKVPELESDRADDIIAAMDELGIEQTDLVAESAGALRAMVAIAAHPERFRNVVLIHPAGMDDNGSIMTHGHVVHHQLRSVMDPRLLTERFGRKTKRVTSDGNMLHSSEKGFRWIRAEQKTVAKSRFHELLPELKKHHPHLQFTIVADQNDYNFRPRRLKKVNGQHLFRFITSRWRGHGMGQKQERIEEVASLLQQMGKKEQKASVTNLHQRFVEEPLREAA